jgi:hypothetical protein
MSAVMEERPHSKFASAAPLPERMMQRIESLRSSHRSLSAHAAVFNTFVQRRLTSASAHRTLRAAAISTRRNAIIAA